MASTYNLEIDQGADFGVTFTYELPAGTPVNVTGYTALLQIRTAPGSTVLLELTNGSGISVGTTNGQFVVAMTGAQTLTLIQEECHYDLLITSGGGVKTRLIEGTVTVDLAISES